MGGAEGGGGGDLERDGGGRGWGGADLGMVCGVLEYWSTGVLGVMRRRRRRRGFFVEGVGRAWCGYGYSI